MKKLMAVNTGEKVRFWVNSLILHLKGWKRGTDLHLPLIERSEYLKTAEINKTKSWGETESMNK